MPIHALLVRNRVNIVFHGHDHFYGKQDLDASEKWYLVRAEAGRNGLPEHEPRFFACVSARVA